MKTIFRILVFLFLANSVNAQIVNIPDANFKTKLLQADVTNTIAFYTKVDVNNDGEIQETEALAITQLDVKNSNISSLTGIEFFLNLIGLDCSNNQITNLDVTQLLSLGSLSCKNNALQSLNASGLVDLETFEIDFNPQLTTLNIANCSSLTQLFQNNGVLSNVNVSGCTSLLQISLENHNLTSFDASGLVGLQHLDLNENQLTSINVDGCINMTFFECMNNQLPTISVSNLPNLSIIRVENNQLTSFNLTNLPLLTQFFCSGNPLTVIDLSNLPSLNEVIVGSPTPIEWLNIKNGISTIISEPATINYVCADEIEFSQFDNSSIVTLMQPVNSYCSFTPGGNYNTITGTTTFDADNNGCDVADLPKSSIKININDGTNQGTTFTNNSSVYNFYTQAGSFTLTPNIENPSWFTFSPATATIPFANNNNNVVTQDFCISPNGIHHDLEVVIAPLTPARPGFDAVYQIVYKNKGNQTLSGDVSLTFDDNITDFVSAIPNPDNLAVNSLSWNYINLLPFESRTINVTLNVNAPTDTPPVNIGAELDFVVGINPVVNDEIPLDNVFGYNQTVVGSFDPNTIECLEGEVVPPSYIGQYLHYAVNFENTGNFPAENIVVKIIIDTTKYDMNSLQLLNVSHNSYTRITGNIVEVIFQQINLDSGGHGNLLFKIRTNSNLVEGNSVAKRADIFFDYNAPIDTGMANTTFQVLSNTVFELDNSISIYPNPTNGKVNIKVNINVNDNSNNTIKSVELYDVQGRLLQTQLLDEVQTSIDISEKSNGIYFLKITSDKGGKVEKIIKE